MKTLFIITILIVGFHYSPKAQNNTEDKLVDYAFKRDTINVTGYVYNFDGTIAKNTVVTRKLNNGEIFNEPYSTKTNDSGFFNLKGVSFQDTLYIPTSDNFIKVVIKGARYLAIYLPPPAVRYISAEVSVAKRHKKPLETYKIRFSSQDNAPIVYTINPDAALPQPAVNLPAFKQMLSAKLNYPDAAIENNIEGIVELNFSVLPDGQTADYKIIKGLGFGCDEAAIKAMKDMPRWKPGLVNKIPYEARVTIDVEFKLTD